MPRSVATSISTSGAASMTPKAFFTGREIGAMTARALTLRIARLLALMVAPLPDAIPSQEARRRPVGRHRFNQPLADMLGGKCDALGLPIVERQRIEPEWLPAIGRPIGQAV